MVTVTLKFEGGPLDGSVKTQPILREWKLVRYEHSSRSEAEVWHIYSGKRDHPDVREVRLQYLGPTRNGTAT